jgi:ABC-type glycerol-3-phosphate transport system permease component
VKHQREFTVTTLRTIVSAVVLGAILFPFLSIIFTSFKPLEEAMSVPPKFLPFHWTGAAYQRLFGPRNFNIYIINSLIVACLSVVVSTIIGGWTAYGLSRFWFKGKSHVNAFILICLSFPGPLLVIPYFQIMIKIHLFDSIIALILAYLTFTLPFITWMLKAYFDTIPKELDEAAIIDGCSHYAIFWKVILPLAKPGYVATGIYAFLNSWNEYMFGLTLTSSEASKTIPVALGSLLGEFMTDWPCIMAGAVVASLPVIILFFFMQKQLIYGLTGGAVKG